MRLDDRMKSIYSELSWRGLTTEKIDWLHSQQGMAMKRAKELEDMVQAMRVVLRSWEGAGERNVQA